MKCNVLNTEVKTSNRNLLDNPFFTVNQRSATTVTGGYGVDRWVGAYTITQNGLSIAPTEYFMQKLEDTPLGVDLTFSAKLSDGTVVSGTHSLSDLTSREVFYDKNHLQLLRNELGFFQIWTDSSYVIRAVKLELGSVSTLANDVAPNYAEELAKCQRYFERVKLADSASFATGLVLTPYDTSHVHFSVIPKVKKRITPTAVMYGTYSLSGGNGSMTATVALSGEISAYIAGDVVRFAIGHAAATYNNWSLIAQNAYIDFSADL